MNDCWCCDRPAPVTPRAVFNRPALSAIKYRVGTFSAFRRAMLEAIAAQPALKEWTSRDADDYGVEILEWWAYLADVLTFYQERYANEAFLRTAVQRESLMRLAALIDYSLAPGVAATAYLAFTVDKTNPALPAGLRVQSKPAPGQAPATFETGSSLPAFAAVNRFRVWPVPTCDLENYGAGTTQAIISQGGGDLKPGQTLVFFAGSLIEEKKIDTLTRTERGMQLGWSPAIVNSFSNGAEVYRFARKFSLFGRNAPTTYAKTTTDGSGNVTGAQQVTTDFSQNGGTRLYLDGVMKDLQVNSQVLVNIRGDASAGNFNGLFSVTGVAPVGRAFGPLTATVTQIDLQPVSFPAAVPHVADIRTVQVYEVTSDEISFTRQNFDAQISAGATSVFTDRIVKGDLRAGSYAILADDFGQAEQVTITGIDDNTCEGGVVVEFTPPIKNTYPARTAVIYGNVAKATHGETVKDETLGSGDGSRAAQSFTLQKSPVTFTSDPGAPSGAKNSLRVLVDGVYWKPAANFFNAQANDRVYVATIDETNAMHVEFGNGERGARLPSGRSNVHAQYRKGWGKAGSVAGGQIKTLLDAVPGLKSAVNPAASFGWADPETVSAARRNAPTTVLTFDRAVSLLDFENLARAYPGVGKARAAWVWRDEAQVVQLTCAASDGGSIVPLQSDLLAFLDARRDPNRALEIIDYTPVGIKLHAYIVADPDRVAGDVQIAAQDAMGTAQLSDESYGFFAFARLNLDEDIHLSEVYAALQNVPGVLAVEVAELHRVDNPGATLPQNIVPIGPAELATLADPSDLVIELKDAL